MERGNCCLLVCNIDRKNTLSGFDTYIVEQGTRRKNKRKMCLLIRDSLCAITGASVTKKMNNGNIDTMIIQYLHN